MMQNGSMKTIGYLRDRGVEQKVLDTQKAVLRGMGCVRIFVDTAESKGAELEGAVKELCPGDLFVVPRLASLGKTTKGLMEFICKLNSMSIDLKTVDDSIDTRDHRGRFLAHFVAQVVAMDRELANERTKKSLRIAKEKGRVGGRPPALTAEQKSEAARLIASGMPVRQVAKVIGSNHATLYRNVGAKPVASRKGSSE